MFVQLFTHSINKYELHDGREYVNLTLIFEQNINMYLQNMYLQFPSRLHTDTTQVVEIFPRVRKGPT